MRNKETCLWISFIVTTTTVVALSSRIGAQPQEPPPVRATITLSSSGISIDRETIVASRGRSVQYDILNNTNQQRTVELTNFRLGTMEDGECVPGDETSEPLRGRTSDDVPSLGEGRIRVAVKNDADTGCYKYDIEATDLDTLDPVLDIDR